MEILKKTLQNFIKNTINPLAPTWHLLASFLAFMMIENFLEIFSDTPRIPFKFIPLANRLFLDQNFSIIIWFIHCVLWWICAVLAFIIILNFFTKEPLLKTTRFILNLGWVLPLTPIIDLMISGGQGVNIHYVRPDQFLTLNPHTGATPGESVSALLFLFFFTTYMHTKGTSIRKILSALGCVVGFLFLLFTLNSYVAFLIAHSGQSLNIANNPLIISRVLLGMIILEIVLIKLTTDGKRWKDSIHDCCCLPWLCHCALFIMGMALYRHGLLAHIFENFSSFILSQFVIFSLWLVMNKPKPSHQMAALLLAATAAILVNFITFYLFLTSLSILVLSRIKPFETEQKPVAMKFVHALLATLTIMAGFHFAQGNILEFTPIFIFYFIIMPGFFLNFTDLNNTAICGNDINALLGPKLARLFIAIVFGAAAILLPFVFLDIPMLSMTIPACAMIILFLFKYPNARKPIFATLLALIFLIAIRLSF